MTCGERDAVNRGARPLVGDRRTGECGAVASVDAACVGGTADGTTSPVPFISPSGVAAGTGRAVVVSVGRRFSAATRCANGRSRSTTSAATMSPVGVDTKPGVDAMPGVDATPEAKPGAGER